ncbi:restriction endonuclease [Candidatus Woesearchaeota archaeon]|nr:restriction endonuclease [Candidatus Woesearchaeota archaeon]
MTFLTPEQASGTRFEIWVEELLKDNGYWGVRRNVEYHQQRYVFRQVDVEYQDLNVLNPLVLLNSLVILELKYSIHGRVNSSLQQEKKKSGQLLPRIDTIVNELEERRKFVNARKAILTTNGHFSDEVHREVQQYRNIELWEKEQLNQLDKRRRGLMDYLFPKIPLDKVGDIDLSSYGLNSKKEKV